MDIHFTVGDIIYLVALGIFIIMNINYKFTMLMIDIEKAQSKKI